MRDPADNEAANIPDSRAVMFQAKDSSSMAIAVPTNQKLVQAHAREHVTMTKY